MENIDNMELGKYHMICISAWAKSFILYLKFSIILSYMVNYDAHHVYMIINF